MVALDKAAEIVASTIRDSLTHTWYQRTVEEASLWTDLYTGEGLENRLRKIVTRETDKQFDLRKKLFFPIPPAVGKKARVPFSKVPKADGLVEAIEYDGKDKDIRGRLDMALDGFYGDESLDDYMADRFLDLNITDPNAYIIVDFDPFDPDREVAKPYPLEVSSAQCINKGMVNNTTQWIIGKWAHTYVDIKADGTVTKMPGHRFVMYFGLIYDLRQVSFSDRYPTKIDPSLNEQVVTLGDRSFSVHLINPFSDRQTPEFQGVCVGHIKDVKTGGETYVSILGAAKYRMLETMKSGSEHSLVMALCAHPEVFQLLPKCTGEGYVDNVNRGCMAGECPETRSKCASCNGSGKRLPTSVLDATYFDLPDDPDGTNVMDLAKLKHYSAPDTAIITVLSEYVYKLENKCLQDIFTSVSMDDKSEVETATKVNVDEDAQNNAVYPYGRKWATVKIKLVRMVAAFTDADKGLNYTCKVPSRLQLAPLETLIDRANKAKNLGDPMLLDLMQRDLMVNKLAERPLELRKYEVRKRFRPLEGTTPEQKREFMSMLPVRERVLLAYENEVYHAMNQVAGFYYMDHTQQEGLIGVKVNEIMARIQREKAAEVDFAELMENEVGAAA